MEDLIKRRSQHGGDIYSNKIEEKSKRIENEKDLELLDLSSNINPMELPNKVYEELKKILDKAKCYPDIEYYELKKDISDYLNKMLNNKTITYEDIVLGNGAVEVIDKTIASFNHIIIIRPSFIEYKLSSLRYSKDITFVDRKIDDLDSTNIIKNDFMDSIIKNIKYKKSLVIICNPNNPDGAIFDIEAIRYLLKGLIKWDSYLLVDETFSEFIGDINKNALSLMGEFNNLIVIKALTKFFGLPGVRLGYGVTKNKDLIQDIIIKQTTWNVGTFAENIAKIMLKDEEYIDNSIKENHRNKKILNKVLVESNIFNKIYFSYADFITVKLKESYEADDFLDFLKKKGILIRSLYNMEPFNKKYFRIAVKKEKDIYRLKNSLEEFKNLKELTLNL